MLGNTFEQARNTAWRIVRWQFGATVIVTIIMGLIAGNLHAYAALAGGSIAVVASSIVAMLVFKKGRATSAEQFAKAFRWAEAARYLITLVGFAIVIIVLKPPMASVFAGFVAAYSMYWFALLITARVK